MLVSKPVPRPLTFLSDVDDQVGVKKDEVGSLKECEMTQGGVLFGAGISELS